MNQFAVCFLAGTTLMLSVKGQGHQGECTPLPVNCSPSDGRGPKSSPGETFGVMSPTEACIQSEIYTKLQMTSRIHTQVLE